MRTALVLLMLAFSAAAPAAAAEAVAIKGARILPAAGEEIAAGTVVIRNGRIEAMGADVPVPWDARVVPGEGLVLTPGFVLPHTQGGLDRPNERMPVTPFVSVVDSIDPASNFFRDALRQGITTILVAPGDETVIGGLAAIVRPVGVYVDEMLVVRDAGVKIALAPRRGVNRMVQMAELRRALDSAVRYREDHERAVQTAKQEDKPAPEIDPEREPMLRLLSGELPAIFSCEKSMDVLAGIRLLDEYRLKGIFLVGPDCAEAAPLLAKRKLPVVYGGPITDWKPDPETGREVHRFGAGPLHEAGHPFGLSAGGPGLADGLLWYRAALLVREGVPRAYALRAVTADAAAALGLAETVGTIEPGKVADLVLWTGDPFSAGSFVSRVFLAGETVYEREKDHALAEIGGRPEAPATPAEDGK